MFHVETFGDPVRAIEPEREAGASHRLRGPGKGWSKVNARSELSADNSDPSSYRWWPGRRRLRPMPLTALFRLTVLRRVSGCEGGPTKVTNLTVIPFRTKPRNLFASGVARKFNSPGVRRTEAGPQGNRQGVSSTSVPGKLAAANSRRLTLSRGRRPRSSPTGPSKRRHHILKIAVRAPQFVIGQAIKFVTFCLRLGSLDLRVCASKIPPTNFPQPHLRHMPGLAAWRRMPGYRCGSLKDQPLFKRRHRRNSPNTRPALSRPAFQLTGDAGDPKSWQLPTF